MRRLLPAPLGSVKLRELIPVTLLGDPGKCLLSALRVPNHDTEEWRLFPSRESLWGQFFHETVQKATRLEPPEDKEMWCKGFLKNELLAHGNIKQMYSYDEWVSACSALRAMLLKYVGTQVRGHSRRLADPGSHPHLGFEVVLASKLYPVTGRADQIFLKTTDVYSIVDYKSGWVFGPDGTLSKSVRMQLLAYAMILRELEPVRSIEIVVSTPEKTVSIPTSPSDDNEVVEEILRIRTLVALGKTTEAGVMATPGDSCFFCQTRPACEAYLKAAPVWWSGPPMERRRPNDTWGSVISISNNKSNTGIDITLMDPNGSLRTIKNVDGKMPVSISDQLYAFDLWASPVRQGAGFWLHPRLFFAGRPYPTGFSIGTCSLFFGE